VDKTHIASSLEYKAAQAGLKVRFTVRQLILQPSTAGRPGKYKSVMQRNVLAPKFAYY